MSSNKKKIHLKRPFSLPKFSGKSKGKKQSAPAKPVETGTAGDDVDYEWIPRSALRTPGSNRYDNEEPIPEVVF